MSPSNRATDQEIQAWVNGELPEENMERVVAAVMSDPHAAAQLDECLQLRALAVPLRESDRGPTPDTRAESDRGPTPDARAESDRGPTPDARAESDRARRRRIRRLLSSSAVFAAALAVVCVATRPRIEGDVATLPDRQLIAALGPRRYIEPRLSWPAADGYRGYETDRAGGRRQVEPLSFELLARVEARKDPRALVGAQLLVGNVDRARQELERAPDTADTWSDRAAIALLAGDHERALYATDQALARAGDHAQARWNRALALVGLGLDRSAAAAFSQLAQRGELGWSAEASNRAAVLVAQRVRRTEAWNRAKAATEAMLSGGPPALDQVDAYPVLVRQSFYDAVRAAPSPERVRALEPLARALDARSGGDALVHYVRRIATQPFSRRAKVAGRYAELVADKLTDLQRAALVRELRAGSPETDDILLGALPFAGPVRKQIRPADAAEYTRLAEATADPWFGLLAREQNAMLALDRGDIAGAASQLQAAAAQCTSPSAIALRCYQIFRWQTYTYQVMHRVKAMSDAWARAWRSIVGTGMVEFEDDALRLGVDVANRRDDTGGMWLGLTGAYFDEWVWSKPSCAEIAKARGSIVQSLINRNLVAEARALIDDEPHCDPPFTARRAFLLGQLVRDAASIAALQRSIETLRAAPTTNAGDRALLDHVEGRVLLTSAPEVGRALLRRVITNADAGGDDPRQARVRGYSYSVLVQEAGQRSAWSEALSLLAEERRATLPERCALGAAEEEAAVFVARGRDGRFRGAYVPLSNGQATGGLTVPADLQAMLAGCDVVDIYARNPYHGRAGLFAPGIPIRFRTGDVSSRVPGPGPVIVIGNIVSPPELGLSPLQPVVGTPGTTLIDGPGATPARVLEAMRNASFIEVHSHGLVDVADDDAAMLVLAADVTGRYALTATDVAQIKLAAHPIVVLAACEAATSAPAFHAVWGLPDAFLHAGASAVIASTSAIQDAAASKFFQGVRTRIQAGSAPAVALRDEREAWRDPAQRRWIDQLVVFQ